MSEDIEHTLRVRRAELQAELDRLTAPPAEGASVSYGKRVGDGTTEAVERLATTATARSLATSIADIDRALETIGSGTYGICDGCGGAIPSERLGALPASALCVECASAVETLNLRPPRAGARPLPLRVPAGRVLKQGSWRREPGSARSPWQ